MPVFQSTPPREGGATLAVYLGTDFPSHFNPRPPRGGRLRGYIVRALAKGNQNSLLVRQVTNALLADNLITVPDISKQLSYLEDGGYIEFTDRRATAYNAYRRDAVIQLTKAGVDLVEGTREDPGVDV